MDATRVAKEIARRDELRKVYDARIKELGRVIHPMRQDELRRIQIDILSTFDAMSNQDYPGMAEYMDNLRRSHTTTLMAILSAKDDVTKQDASYKSKRVDDWVDKQVAVKPPVANAPQEEPALELDVSQMDLELLQDLPMNHDTSATAATGSRNVTVRSEVHKIEPTSRDAKKSETNGSRRTTTRGRERLRTRQPIRGRRHATLPPPRQKAEQDAEPPGRSQIARDWNVLRTKFKIPKLKGHSVSPPMQRVLDNEDLPPSRPIPIKRNAMSRMAINPFRRDLAACSATAAQQHDPNIHDYSTLPGRVEPIAAPVAHESRPILERLGPRVLDQQEASAPPLEALAITDPEEQPPSDDLINGMGPWPDFLWPPMPKRSVRQAKRHRSADVRMPPACLCCIMFGIVASHAISQCPHFILFSIDQRRILVDCWHICADCWHYGHKQCETGQRCNSRECASQHSRLLCPINELANIAANRAAYKPPSIDRRMASMQPPYCLCCIAFKQLLTHSIWECAHLLGLSVGERNDMFDRWNLCRSCGSYGHATCRGELRCNKYEHCLQIHHRVLCEFERTADIVENKRRSEAARLFRVGVARKSRRNKPAV